MSGYVIVGETPYEVSYVPDGKSIRIDYGRCKICLGRGVILDGNGEPKEWCTCSTGEAVRQAGNPFGVPS